MYQRANQSMSYLDKSFLSVGGNEPERFDPKDFIIPETTERDIEIYKEIYDLMDSENDGILKPFDFRKAFIQCGYNIPRKNLYQIISDFDGDESGVIEFKEFVQMMVMTPCKKDSDDDIKRTFDQIARTNKESITKEDIKELVQKLNKDTHYKPKTEENITDEQLDRIFQELGAENDQLSWKKFLEFNKNFLKYLK